MFSSNGRKVGMATEEEKQLVLTCHRILVNQLYRVGESSFFDNSLEEMHQCAWKRAVRLVLEDDREHRLAVSHADPMKVTYASKQEYALEPTKRTRTSLQRYFRRQLEVSLADLPDHLLDELCTRVMVVFHPIDTTKDIEILTGEAIGRAYEQAVGAKSCMTGDCRMVEVYSDNPDKVGLVVLRKTQARALLWNTDQGVKLLDRIYPNSGVHVKALHAWCGSLGYDWRSSQGAEFNGTHLCGEDAQYTVTLKYCNDLPFLDTMQHRHDSIAGTLVLASYYEDDKTMCVACEERCWEDDMQYYDGEAYCEECWSERFFTCSQCDDDYPQDEGVFLSIRNKCFCQRCFERSGGSFCDHCGTAVLLSDEGGSCGGCEEVYCGGCGESHLTSCEAGCGEYCKGCFEEHISKEHPEGEDDSE